MPLRMAGPDKVVSTVMGRKSPKTRGSTICTADPGQRANSSAQQSHQGRLDQVNQERLPAAGTQGSQHGHGGHLFVYVQLHGAGHAHAAQQQRHKGHQTQVSGQVGEGAAGLFFAFGHGVVVDAVLVEPGGVGFDIFLDIGAGRKLVIVFVRYPAAALQQAGVDQKLLGTNTVGATVAAIAACPGVFITRPTIKKVRLPTFTESPGWAPN